MNFQDFNFRTEYLTNTNSFTYRNIAGQDCEINVKEYLPASDKIDLIQIALQKSEEDGIYNEIKLDMYFHLNLIYLYTDIEFSIEDREDEMQLYDILESNDIINQVIACIPEEEYNSLKEYLVAMEESYLTYKNTAAAVLTKIIQDLPKNAAAAKEIVDSFDPSKYQAVADFATAANGGRNINTNLPVNKEEDALSTAAPPVTPSVESKSKKVVQIKSAAKKD